MAASDQETDAGEHDRWVFIQKAKCPRCESTDLKTTRSVGQGDGSQKRTTVCGACKHRFYVILE